jgi:hypothetical protein
MTKQTEALRMAIEAMNSSYSSQGYPARAAWLYHGCDVKLFKAIQACKEALEPTVAELNDEYLRDTHVEGMPKDGDCCTEGCIKCDARKVLAETQEPMIIKQENGMVLKLGYDELPNGTAFYTKPPSREWQSLSDEEIEDAVNYLNIKIDYPIMFARLIEMHLKEKNNE